MQSNDPRDPWYFDQASDDLRGWTVRSDDGTALGKITQLLVDTESGYVTTVILDGGRRFDARELAIGDNELIVVGAAPADTMAELVEEPTERLPEAEIDMQTAKERVTEEVTGGPERMSRPNLELVEEEEPRILREAPAIREDDNDIVVQLVDEELEVSKRAYEAGGVHLTQHVITEPVTKDLRLHEERVSVQRSKVDRSLDSKAADELFHDQTYEMTATAEVPVIRKSAHVVEEIVVKKNAFEHDETIQETVRQMDAEIIELRASEALEGARR